tara:strand:- start:1490 stop:1831 length:342 start_codon:yes stop_codon:yes gene_type:complete
VSDPPIQEYREDEAEDDCQAPQEHNKGENGLALKSTREQYTEKAQQQERGQIMEPFGYHCRHKDAGPYTDLANEAEDTQGIASAGRHQIVEGEGGEKGTGESSCVNGDVCAFQ